MGEANQEGFERRSELIKNWALPSKLGRKNRDGAGKEAGRAV